MGVRAAEKNGRRAGNMERGDEQPELELTEEEIGEIVTGFGFVAYLWNIGFFNRRPADGNGPNPNADDNNNNVNDEENEDDERALINQEVNAVRQATTGEINRNAAVDNDNDDGEEEEDGEAVEQLPEQQQQLVPQPPVQPSPLNLAFTFVTTFISSILPEQNAVV